MNAREPRLRFPPRRREVHAMGQRTLARSLACVQSPSTRVDRGRPRAVRMGSREFTSDRCCRRGNQGLNREIRGALIRRRHARRELHEKCKGATSVFPLFSLTVPLSLADNPRLAFAEPRAYLSVVVVVVVAKTNANRNIFVSRGVNLRNKGRRQRGREALKSEGEDNKDEAGRTWLHYG